MNNEQELIAERPASSADYQLIKIENEQIAAMAQAKPRDNRKVLAELVDQIEAYPTFAESVVYAKPIGKDKSGRMQYARGLSIRAAEAIAAAWGYCRISQSVDPIDDDHVKVTASFTDIQSGRIWTDSGIVSKFYKKSGGGVARHADDRFFNVVVKAELSKRVREAIIRCVPPGVRSELQAIAERRVAALLTNDTIERIVQSFAGLGVTLAQLENLLGKPIKAGWTIDDRVTLQGIYTAIRDGESTVAEAFGAPVQPNQSSSDVAAALGGAPIEVPYPSKKGKDDGKQN